MNITDQARKVLDDVLEARRYAVRNPTLVKQMINGIRNDLTFVDDLREAVTQEDRHRIQANLAVGAKFIQVDPEILQGYLWGAHFELSAAMDKHFKEKS